jgi:hypothetical protein
LEESLVAELMMRPGFDATMIGPLPRIRPDDTDFLCVSSFNHSLAILTWLPLEDLKHHWLRLGLLGKVVSRNERAQTSIAPSQRIYHLQLSPGSNVQQIVAELDEILSDRRVKTVSIEMLGDKHSEAPKPRDKASHESADAVDYTGTVRHEKQPGDKQPGAAALAAVDKPLSSNSVHPAAANKPGQELDRTNGTRTTVGEEDEPEWEHLEQLFDDFDALDL